MRSIIGWLFGLAVAVCLTVAAAKFADPKLHIGTCALVALAIALIAVRSHQRLIDSGAPASAIASSTARYLGLVWAWGALSVIATYLLVVQNVWPEWWQFFMGFAFAAIASIAFSAMLDRDHVAGRADPVLLKAGRVLIQVQIAGMAVGIVSLFVDHKFLRDVTHADWAGNNILFVGALAIAAICIDALRSPAHV